METSASPMRDIITVISKRVQRDRAISDSPENLYSSEIPVSRFRKLLIFPAPSVGRISLMANGRYFSAEDDPFVFALFIVIGYRVRGVCIGEI